MQEMAVKYVLWGMIGIVLAGAVFYVFGVEMPIYLLLAIVGLLVYAYSPNLVMKFVAGYVGRFFAVLFIISMFYYIGTKAFFPSDPFTFRFFSTGIIFSIDFFNAVSDFIGKLVLKFIDIIIS